MTMVRIDVDSGGLGDITITRDDHLRGFRESEARAAIAEQLAEAVAQLCYAFEIDTVAVTSRIEEAERNRHADPLIHGDAASG